MIEVIYKEEKQEAQGNEAFVSVPRNIRQIGLAGENCRIYIEDYVYTFLVRLSRSEDKKEGQKARIAVLTGETKWHSGITYLFIKGALMTEGMEAAADHIDFTEEVWGKIHEEQEQYFKEQEIVGWFCSQPQLPMETTELFNRVHLRHFGGEKVLMLMEPLEREDAFFRYENSFMVKQSGYYIYYEKNPEMQTYMIEKNKDLQPETTESYKDDAVKSFREIITNKKTEDKKDEASVFSYAATACLAAAVLVVGVNFYRSYQKVQNVEQEIKQASSVIVEEVTSTPAPVPTPTPMPTPAPMSAPTPVPKTKKETETKADVLTEKKQRQEEEKGVETGGSSVYREEADVRKAKRREELALKEQESKAADSKETASGEIKSTYVIRPGDTIYQISMDRYGSMEAMEEICRLNGISLEEIIYPGQIIVLP